ncbi:MAG: DUF6883 domain-containing protein, partial [Fimbriiglobus sp.]
LGFTAADTEILGELLLHAAKAAEAKIGTADEYGQRFETDIEATTAVGVATIRVAWIVKTDEDFPRLTTCYVLPR